MDRDVARNQIVDSNGNNVKISGVNWFGLETVTFAPHGLNYRSYKSMMDQMKTLGFNTIRLPFSNQLFDSSSVPSGIDYSKNPELVGLRGVGIIDKIVDYAGQIGLRIILDCHRNDAGNGPNDNGLWYTPAHPESRWIADWTMLATRYAGNPTVIGADLENGLRSCRGLRQCGGNVCARLEVKFYDRHSGKRLRLGVLDVGDGGLCAAFGLQHDPGREILGREPRIVPDDGDDRDPDVRKDVGGRAQNRKQAEQQDH